MKEITIKLTLNEITRIRTYLGINPYLSKGDKRAHVIPILQDIIEQIDRQTTDPTNTNRILRQIHKYKEISYEQLLQLNFRHLTKTDFDSILSTLEESNMVSRHYENNKTILKHEGYKRGGN